jgi:murein DD-endopeptidase MepM/ murein hydrolase activator NlpD
MQPVVKYSLAPLQAPKWLLGVQFKSLFAPAGKTQRETLRLQFYSSRLLPILIASALTLPLAARMEAATTPPQLEHGSGEAHAHSKEEAHQRLKEIQKNRDEVHRQLREARKKEQAAIEVLHQIKHKLNQTTEELNNNQHNLKKTEHKIQETEHNITQTKSQSEIMSEEAGARLREIYEGQRLGLVEMLFQVSSLQTLLDLFYYQERIADTDRRILDDLHARAAALAEKKDQLGSKRNILGEVISQIAQKALLLNRQKDDQEAVADRLRTQRAFYEQAERQLEVESHQLEHQIVDMCSGKDGKALTQGSGTFSMPLHASITSPFGWRRHPIFGVRKFHTGIDIAGPNHSQIHAADSGSIIYSGYYGGYGKVVIVSHGKGMATLYAHMSRAAVNIGQSVQKGDLIGYEGTTGFSTGPHLHFEVRVDGKPNNPLNYVH